jgi:hypothetical protein
MKMNKKLFSPLGPVTLQQQNRPQKILSLLQNLLEMSARGASSTFYPKRKTKPISQTNDMP